ncbi:hypothetical protein Glove_292g80 [Diversispora epigaea]|uniref:Uncharacterized protein n=1 Tax=Diversispora epigaea TaxID=1348612 RepID=A0A397I535_9GLOM|nr:hypothetical protein Glove_292g80 [Diversispora epigaea]
MYTYGQSKLNIKIKACEKTLPETESSHISNLIDEISKKDESSPKEEVEIDTSLCFASGPSRWDYFSITCLKPGSHQGINQKARALPCEKTLPETESSHISNLIDEISKKDESSPKEEVVESSYRSELVSRHIVSLNKYRKSDTQRYQKSDTQRLAKK